MSSAMQLPAEYVDSVILLQSERNAPARARDTLEAAHLHLATATSTEEAVAWLDEATAGLIVIDAAGLQGSPAEIVARIRQHPAEQKLPILVLISPDQIDSLGDAFAAGASDYAVQPVDWSLLVHRIRTLTQASSGARELERARCSLETTQRLAQLGNWEWEPGTARMSWSDEVFKLLGLDAGDHLPSIHLILDRVVRDDAVRVQSALDKAMSNLGRFSIDHRIRLASGEVRHVRQCGQVDKLGGDGSIRLSAVMLDVTDQALAHEKVRFFANYDSLTGLSNRRFFHERLERTLMAAKRGSHRMALLYLDLDRFKVVNDTMGHSAGDRLLRTVSERLRESVRSSDLLSRVEGDPDANAISRLGGDEFSVLLTKIADDEDAGEVAARLHEVIAEPFVIDGQEVTTGSSIGIALFPRDATNSADLIHNADAAMYQAKQAGGCRTQFFSHAIHEARLERLRLEAELRQAVEREEFHVRYQPRTRLDTGALCGVEALARWRHSEFGMVSPKRFIPIAEENGMIVELGEWVLREACRQNRAWQDAGVPAFPVSVNVAPRQFQTELLRTVSDALKHANLAPEYLELEITESALLQDDEESARTLRDLQSMGVSISLDDFGTGYSSLSYLTRFPLDCLKMDRSFLRDVLTNPTAAALASAVISMAHSLGLRVVAEGVDSEGQAEYLREQSCDEMQGFLVSGAVSPEEILQMLGVS